MASGGRGVDVPEQVEVFEGQGVLAGVLVVVTRMTVVVVTLVVITRPDPDHIG